MLDFACSLDQSGRVIRPPVLAIDIGTSSVRAALFDLRGKRLPETFSQRPSLLRTGLDGKAEVEPFELLRQTKTCVREAVAGWRSLSGVGLSCFWHSLLGVDDEGNPLTPIYTWADSRCREDAERLRREFVESDVHAETGCMLRSSFWPAKLRWLRRTDRARFKRVKFWVSPGEWIQWRMSGAASCATGMATGTGLFDPSRLAWSSRMIEACHIRANRLLPVSDDPVLWKGVPWFPAIGDGAASNLGCGATEDGLGAINVGTSAAVRVMRRGQAARVDTGLFAYRVDAARYVAGGAVSNAGNLHAWCLCELRLPDKPAIIEKALAGRVLPEHGLTVLPFWTAERAPSWDESTPGVIMGLRQKTDALDILQAVTEGFYYRLAMIAERVSPASPTRWIVSGGITHSRSALQRLATVLGCPLAVSAEPEASLRGAAVFALEKLGATPQPLRMGAPVRPVPRAFRAHAEARERQAQLEALVSHGR